MQRYIIETFDDGRQLAAHGPYKSEKRREDAAGQIKRETDGDSETHRLDIRANGRADFPVNPPRRPVARKKPAPCEVVMQSDDFGRETFNYDSIEEALAGIRRLFDSATAQDDGVERIIGLRMNGE